MKTNFILTIRIFLQLAYFSFHQTNAAFSSLITFDVDGTLVKGSGKAADSSIHCLSFGHAVGKVLGKGTPTQLVSEVLPRQQFHGSTDGLILIRLAQAALEIPPSESFAKLDELMMEMYSFVSEKTDEEISEGIDILPGVIKTLTKLRDMREETSEGGVMKNNIACGLVTGNVEGIARRKMRAVGVWETGALHPPSKEQQQQNWKWKGSEDIAFIGGFGSDYCSGSISDKSRNFLDRGEQLAIAAKRFASQDTKLKRVVHVGDAPADVLAAKLFSEKEDHDYCVGFVGVATGSYSAEELKDLAGDAVPGQWEPVILEDGMADPDAFIRACGVL